MMQGVWKHPTLMVFAASVLCGNLLGTIAHAESTSESITQSHQQTQLPQPWNIQQQNDWVRIQYRDNPITGFVEIKAHLMLNTDLASVRHLLTNTQAVLTWVEGVKRIVVLQKTENTRVQLTILDPVWPVQPREMLTTNILLDSANQFTLKVQDNNQYLKLNPARIRVKQIDVQWQVQQTDEKRVEIDYLGYFQPGGSLPAWLSNEIFLVLISKSLNNLKTVSEQNNGSAE
ncbi:hypothetical protein FE810_15725 [Thalassotalea litorea]|uniref:Uncharacterized protein n=1 Tax=Thalassotalea litorea TaxID=2020715 RepID=A0A5R9IM92_9GAMM|nr:SRPBCC family protein [Thalassotalea litorea]TLU61119.1 hypothetical protein FE810_15725 [Thalassotalea litorea]